jgi:chorismate synthase
MILSLEWKGGGRSSARETIGRVAAGAVAKKVLKEIAGTEVKFYYKRFMQISFSSSVLYLCFIIILGSCLCVESS